MSNRTDLTNMTEGRCVHPSCGAAFAWRRARNVRCFCGREIVPDTIRPDEMVIVYWKGYPGDDAQTCSLDAETRRRGTGPIRPRAPAATYSVYRVQSEWGRRFHLRYFPTAAAAGKYARTLSNTVPDLFEVWRGRRPIWSIWRKKHARRAEEYGSLTEEETT